MTAPTTVNAQITDAVTQTNVKVLADAPAIAMGPMHQSLAPFNSVLYPNAGNGQQQLANFAPVATNQGMVQLNSLDATAAAASTAKVAQSDVPDTLLALLTALKASQR